jgi:hypothetical protein
MFPKKKAVTFPVYPKGSITVQNSANPAQSLSTRARLMDGIKKAAGKKHTPKLIQRHILKLQMSCPKHAIRPRREILPPKRREELGLPSGTGSTPNPPRRPYQGSMADQRHRTSMEQQRPPRPAPPAAPRIQPQPASSHLIESPKLRVTRHGRAGRTPNRGRRGHERAGRGPNAPRAPGKEPSRRAKEPTASPRGADLTGRGGEGEGKGG